MNLVKLGTLSLLAVAGWALPAWADLAGLEHLENVTFDCPKSASESVRPEGIGEKTFVCRHPQRLCTVYSNKVRQFEGLISADCEVTSAASVCLSFEECAKPGKLSPEALRKLQHLDDPNMSRPDGAANPQPNLNPNDTSKRVR